MRRSIVTFLSLIILFICNSAAAQKRVLKVMHIYDAFGGGDAKENVDWLNNLTAKFKNKFPSFEVELEMARWDQIDAKSMIDYRAGIAHDVVWSSPQHLPKHQLVGDLLDMTPFIKWTQEEIKDFSWNPIWKKCNFNGTRLGIPIGAHTRGLLYRRDYFRDAGLDPDNPPATLEELVDFAKKLTCDTDNDGKIDVWGLGLFLGPSRATAEISFAPLLWHFGGELWDSRKKQAVFASPAGVKAAGFIAALVNEHKIVPRWSISGTYDDVILRPFLKGRYAMVFGWGSYWISVLEDYGFTKNIFPPKPEGTGTKTDFSLIPTKEGAQFTNSWTVSIHKLSRQPEVAFKFIELLAGAESLLAFPDAGLPTRLSIWKRPEYRSRFYKRWQMAIQKGRSMPSTAHYDELVNSAAKALQDIIAKNAPIEKTLLKYQKQFNKRFAGE